MVVNIGKTWMFRGVLLVLFVALLSYVLFLANGYQYDSYSHQIRKTGIIQISYSDPQGKVFLDGKKLEGTLPFVASNVLPGEYNLLVRREGFRDYSMKVKVDEDLISTVGSVFLYPTDVLAKSRLVFDWALANVKLDQGNLFIQQKNQLYWAKLRDDLTFDEMRKSAVKADPLDNVQVFGREALLQYQDGSRQIMEMFGGTVSDLKISNDYVFCGDKWVYYHNNWFSAFDRNLQRVLWVKNLVSTEPIKAVKFWDVNDRQFLSVLLGAGKGYLYEIKGDNLVQLLDKEVSQVLEDNQDNLYFLENGNEIWSWPAKAKSPQLLARFQDQVQLWSVDLNFYKNSGLIVFAEKGKVYLADLGFNNIVEMFPGLDVGGMEVMDHSKVFFVDKFEKSLEKDKSLQQRLLMLDLER